MSFRKHALKTLIFLSAVATFPAYALDFSGTWVVSGDIDDDAVSPTCTLTQSGQDISGTCKLDGEHAVDARGVVKGKEVTWSYRVTDASTVYKVSFSGLIGEDKLMQGTISVDPSDASGEFTARRQ